LTQIEQEITKPIENEAPVSTPEVEKDNMQIDEPGTFTLSFSLLTLQKLHQNQQLKKHRRNLPRNQKRCDFITDPSY
jgi:hypothetical protein